MFSQFLERDSKVVPNCEKRKFFDFDEEIFFRRIQKALPNCLIFPRVQLASILEAHVSNEKKRHIMRQKLQERYVDFGIFNRDLDLLCVIELENDVTTNKTEEYPTRALLKQAKIKSIRWSRSNLPTAEQILRSLAPYSELDAPKVETTMQTIGKLFLDSDSDETSSIQEKAFTYVEHGNPYALSLAAIRRIIPDGHVIKEYPHIWQKICLFAGDPGYLKNYLESLFVQNRPVRRRGLPLHVAKEVIAIQEENTKFVTSKDQGQIWDPKISARH